MSYKEKNKNQHSNQNVNTVNIKVEYPSQPPQGEKKKQSNWIVKGIILGLIGSILSTMCYYIKKKIDATEVPFVQDSAAVNEKSSPVKEKFCISGFTLAQTEKKMIEDSVGMIYSNESVEKAVRITYNKKSIISFNYANQSLYRFDGSDVEIVINDIECTRFKNALAASNIDRKSLADAQLDGQSKLEYFVNVHRKEIIIKIIACLKE